MKLTKIYPSSFLHSSSIPISSSLVLARSMAELTGVLQDRIAMVEGVKTVAPSLATRISKHEYQWVPFT